MAVTEHTEASLLMSGSEQTIATISAVGFYRVMIDLSTMAASDTIVLSVLQEVLASGTQRDSIIYTATDAQSAPDDGVYTFVIAVPQGAVVSLEQTATGTYRTIPHTIDKVASLTVIESGTHTLSGTGESQLGSDHTTNAVYVLLTDHATSASSDNTKLRVKQKIVSGGADVIVEESASLDDVLSDPDKIQQSIPQISKHSIGFYIQRSAGASHAIPWAICRAGSV